MSALAFILTNGVSYGLILALISIGLMITMGMMRVINLAHGAFAALGGYVAAWMVVHTGLDYLLATLAAACIVAAVAVVVERLLFVHLYKAPELDQVIITLGINFMSIGALTLLFGTEVYPTPLPPYLLRTIEVYGRPFEMYRVAVVVAGLLVMLVLWLVFDRTLIGAKLRAAVDNPGMASVSGVNVPRLFAGSFALGSAMAAIGGALGAPMLPLEPSWPLKYLVPILIVVSLAGYGNLKAVLAVSVIVGVADTAGRYLVPDYGAFPMYITLILLIVWRKDGLFARGAA